MIKIMIFLACALGLTACSQRIGSFTLASTKNLGTSYAPLGTATGEDCAQVFFIVPIGSLNPNLQEAVDKAVAQVPNGDMMINVAVHEDVLFTLLYDRICI